jgi:hypothetical protein
MIYVIVTSAINTPHGIFSAEERLLQTLKTYQNILNHLPTSKILTVDSSIISLTADQKSKLESMSSVVEIADDNLKNIYKNWNIESICKNLCETYAMNKFLSELDVEPNSLFVKLSGRYQFDTNFKLKYQKGKITLSGPVHSGFPDHFSDIKHWYSVRSMVWGSELHNYMIDLFQKLHGEILDHVTIGKYCDMEHAIFKHVPQEIINSVTLGTLGVKGLMAPDGKEIKD